MLIYLSTPHSTHAHEYITTYTECFMAPWMFELWLNINAVYWFLPVYLSFVYIPLKIYIGNVGIVSFYGHVIRGLKECENKMVGHFTLNVFNSQYEVAFFTKCSQINNNLESVCDQLGPNEYWWAYYTWYKLF